MLSRSLINVLLGNFATIGLHLLCIYRTAKFFQKKFRAILEEDGHGLQLRSLEASMPAAQRRPRNSVPPHRQSWRHSLPTRLASGPLFNILHFSPFLTILLSNQQFSHQGILVSVDKENGKLILDDATGTVELSLSRDFLLRPWSLGIFPTTSPFSFLLLHFELDSLAFFFCFCSGMYVMVVGAFLFRTNELPFIVVRLRFPPFFLINDSLVLDM